MCGGINRFTVMDFIKKIFNKFVEVNDEGYNDKFVWSVVDLSIRKEEERQNGKPYLLQGPDYYVSAKNYDLFAVWVLLVNNVKCHCSLDLKQKTLTYHKDHGNFNKFINSLVFQQKVAKRKL